MVSENSFVRLSLYVFVLNIEFRISYFYYYLLLDGFEYVYLKFDSVFYWLAQARFWYFSPNSLQNLQF